MREEVEEKSRLYQEQGLKFKDACHVASAVIASCDYFLSTDDRLLKCKTDEIILMNPVDFIKKWEG